MCLPGIREILQMSVHHVDDEKRATNLKDYQTLHHQQMRREVQ